MADIKQLLSAHFTLEDLTRTDHADLQAANREVSEEQIDKLGDVAALLEICWFIVGPLDAHSGYRCPALNARVGGSERSQHMKAEAADFSPAGPDTEESIGKAFQQLVAAAKAGRLFFGQLIVESAGAGREGRKNWLHISLGKPYRDPAKCMQALKMRDGVFQRIGTI